VDLRGLTWSVTSRAGAKPVGTFTIGSATIGGTPVPTQDASATIASINAVLSQLGLVLAPPVSHLEGDTMFVDPIKVGIAPNATRDQVAGSVLEALQPAREQLFQALLAANCNSASLITVTDILLGSVSGGGSLTAVLGGAQAQLTPDQGAGLASGGPTGSVTFPPTAGGDVGTPNATLGLSGSLPGDTTTSGAPAGTTAIAPRALAARLGSASDGALAVGLGTLALGAALVEADRRKMRQAGVLAAPPAPAPSTEALPG
jgi:hypothetical protein